MKEATLETPSSPPETVQLPLHRRIIWRIGWLLVTVMVVILLRVRVTGWRNVPRTGGALIVANHTTAMDFLMPIWGAWRPVFAIGSEQVFKIPVAGFLLRLFNGAPVAQGVKDRGAVLHLVEAYQKGQLISMFPEGKRSWTGRPLPMTPGSGRLVKSLGCPVVYCRITTGYLQRPRWAAWPRFVPWRMSYDPPVTYPADATAEEITRDMSRRLAINPDDIKAPPFSFGFWMAEGLPAFLWACPSCFAVSSLEVLPDNRSAIHCTACHATWDVDVSTRLTRRDRAEVMTVAAASEKIGGHFSRALDQARWEHEGLALTAESAQVFRLHRGQPTPELLTEGTARMYSDRLEVGREGGPGGVVIPLVDIRAAILEFRSQLVIRTADNTYLVVPGKDSPHMWHHFLMAQVKAAGLEIRS